jgi:Trypsin-co-occurring domain 1
MSAYKLVLSDDSVVWVDQVEQEAESEVARKDGEGRFSDILPSVVSLCQELADVVAKVAPTRATAEFGIGFRVETTGLALLVAKGSADANFVLTLEWERGPSADAAKGGTSLYLCESIAGPSRDGL